MFHTGQRELPARRVAVERDVGRGALGDHAQPVELVEAAQGMLAAGGQQRVGRARADARDAQQLLARSAIDLDRRLRQRRPRVGQLGIGVARQPAVWVEGQLLEIEAVVAQQVGGLVQAVGAQRVFRAHALQRGAGMGREGFEVGPGESEATHQPAGERQQVEVAFAGRPDDELRCGRRPAAAPGRLGGQGLADLLRPAQAGQQLVLEVLARRQAPQVAGRGRLQVDRDAVGELHGAGDLVALGAGHDLEVQVAAKTEAVAQDLGCVDQPVLGACTAADDARGKEQPVGDAALVQPEEQARQLLGLERDALRVAPGAEAAVQAVALAGRRQHRLERAGVCGRRA